MEQTPLHAALGQFSFNLRFQNEKKKTFNKKAIQYQESTQNLGKRAHLDQLLKQQATIYMEKPPPLLLSKSIQQEIFQLYPSVKQLYTNKVPTIVSAEQFWISYANSVASRVLRLYNDRIAAAEFSSSRPGHPRSLWNTTIDQTLLSQKTHGFPHTDETFFAHLTDSQICNISQKSSSGSDSGPGESVINWGSTQNKNSNPLSRFENTETDYEVAPREMHQILNPIRSKTDVIHQYAQHSKYLLNNHNLNEIEKARILIGLPPNDPATQMIPHSQFSESQLLLKPHSDPIPTEPLEISDYSDYYTKIFPIEMTNNQEIVQARKTFNLTIQEIIDNSIPLYFNPSILDKVYSKSTILYENSPQKADELSLFDCEKFMAKSKCFSIDSSSTEVKDNPNIGQIIPDDYSLKIIFNQILQIARKVNQVLVQTIEKTPAKTIPHPQLQKILQVLIKYLTSLKKTVEKVGALYKENQNALAADSNNVEALKIRDLLFPIYRLGVFWQMKKLVPAIQTIHSVLKSGGKK